MRDISAKGESHCYSPLPSKLHSLLSVLALLELQVLPFMLHDSHIRYGYSVKTNRYMLGIIPPELALHFHRHSHGPPSLTRALLCQHTSKTGFSTGIISGTRAFQGHAE